MLHACMRLSAAADIGRGLLQDEPKVYMHRMHKCLGHLKTAL